MECAFDAQNLISISLRKIQSSRTQRGGIKLHKNLLVTFVLRNARQLYVNKNFPQIQRPHHHHHHHHHHQDVTTACAEQDYMELSGSFTELSDEFYCNFGGVESDPRHCGAPQPAEGSHQPAEGSHQDAPACAMAPPSDPSGTTASINACWSCCAEEKSSWDVPVVNTQSNQKTVLDLDTHVVTTVTGGYFHPDCCATPKQAHGAQGGGKKRKMETSYYFVDPEFCLPDLLGPFGGKKIRTDEDFQGNSEQLDNTNISTLLSVLGSGGLSEVRSWQHPDLEHIFASQTICLKQKLLSGSGWTRAIEAF